MRNLMMTTALVATGATMAFASDTAMSPFRAQADAMEIHASDFIGMRVYTSETDVSADAYDGKQTDWDDVGEINDVVLSRDGTVNAVLVDIGGFLGMGERQVAMNMDAVKFVSDDSTADDPDDYFLVVSANRAMLEEAPEYGAMMDETKTSAEAQTENARDGYEPATPDYVTTETLTGARVYDAENNWIGEVSLLLLNDDAQIDKAVVDVGGFLGMGEKPVALDLANLEVLREQGGDDLRVHVTMTKDELEAMETFEK